MDLQSMKLFLDRIVDNAYRLILKGESPAEFIGMRSRRGV